MQNTKEKFGFWESSISPEQVVAKAKRIGLVSSDNGNIYWSELRPDEGGRSTIIRRENDGAVTSILPKEFDARSRVHEYGGNAYLVENDRVFFVNFKDQEIYVIEDDAEPRKITDDPKSRFVDLSLDKKRNRLYAVREYHPSEGCPATEVLNSICRIDLETGAVVDVASGNDFYVSGKLSLDGTKICWISWNHPHMPWHGRELWIAELNEDGIVQKQYQIAGDEKTCVSSPVWHDNGDLYFCMEPENWMNLYRWDGSEVAPVIEREAELAYPDWVPGNQNYCLLKEKIIFSYTHKGEWFLAETDLKGGVSDDLTEGFSGIFFVQQYEGKILFRAERKQAGVCLYLLDLNSQDLLEIEGPEDHGISPDDLSFGELIEFPNKQGTTSYAWYYAPKNSNFQADDQEGKPPLIVMAHGGPTGCSSNAFFLGMQFWTNRGFAVVDVNYGGSTGFGREYRERLDLNWGIVDVQDCVSAVEYLAEKGLVDASKVAIRGGSAGGYTTLAGLVFTDTFKVGASYFGVSSLEALAKDTHKFESRYLDGLIGPYPEAIDVYKSRAPIEHCDKLSCPVIFFQGSEDKVVPPNQAEMMFKILEEKGIKSDYVLYEGEGHGFRESKNIKNSLVRELDFYREVFSG